MRTSPHLSFSAWRMKDAYQDATLNERPYGFCPLDYGCIDAPETISAGSHYSYKYQTMSGYTPLPSCVSR